MAADEHDLEQCLDAALKQYGAVEPRPGLEQRIVARLRMQPSPAPVYWKWLLPLAAVGATVALVLALWLGESAAPHRITRTAPAAQSRNSAEKGRYTAAPQIRPERARTFAKPRRTRRERGLALAAEHAMPRQFPSPRPLSEQDQLLLAFVRRAPRQEVSATLAQNRKTAIRDLSVKDLVVPSLGGAAGALEPDGRN
jgi:hypothetical protein